MTQSTPWELVRGQPYIDDGQLRSAIEGTVLNEGSLDFRTRLLIRDSVHALRSFQGREFDLWLAASPAKNKIEKILSEKFDEPGYPTIRKRLVSRIPRSQIEQIFELLGKNIRHKIDVYIAGSVPSLLSGSSVRPTDDIDFVDEVPAEIREQRKVLERIEEKYGFTLGHVQSHFLPKNWRQRCTSMGVFAGLRVFLVDEYDVFVSKLASRKEKHLDDLRVLAEKLDKERARNLLLTDGATFLENSVDGSVIRENWRFLYREDLQA
ncbi:MAG TPA: DUF6036 family nucleotidyltransferase [Oculatellaceae cyanobacterium]